MPKSCLKQTGSLRRKKITIYFLIFWPRQTQTHTQCFLWLTVCVDSPFQAHYISGRLTNSTLKGGIGRVRHQNRVTHSVSTWQDSPHSQDHSLRDHAAEAMDVCFLLLVSFLSVFHSSTADQPLEEAIIVASKLILFLLQWVIYTISNVERVFFFIVVCIKCEYFKYPNLNCHSK